MTGVKSSLFWTRVHLWELDRIWGLHFSMAGSVAGKCSKSSSQCSVLFFPLYEEAVSAVPSCTRTLARAGTSVCLGSICCCLVGKMCQMASFSINKKLILVGHQFTIPSWTNHKALIEFSEIRGLSANSLDCATCSSLSCSTVCSYHFLWPEQLVTSLHYFFFLFVVVDDNVIPKKNPKTPPNPKTKNQTKKTQQKHRQ